MKFHKGIKKTDRKTLSAEKSSKKMSDLLRVIIHIAVLGDVVIRECGIGSLVSCSGVLIIDSGFAVKPSLQVVGIVGLDLDLHKIDGIISLDGHGIERRTIRLGVLDEIRKIITEPSRIFLIENVSQFFGHVFKTYDMSLLILW